MFQILYPLGLLAALGVIIPILIHLWNIKTGKTLKIGSVFLLGTPSNQRSRSLKVKDWPLLLLRCLLLLLIAFLLAQPVYFQQVMSKEQPGWVLVEKTSFSKVWKQHRHTLDSLIGMGYEIHDFGVSFSRIDLKDTLTMFSRANKAPLPYNSLIRQLDSQHPRGTSMYIFAEQQLRHFSGQQPQTRLNLHWTFLPADSTDLSWLASAHELQNGRVRKTMAHAVETGTYYTREEISKAEAAELKVDTAEINILLYAGKNTTDASYISAVVLAAAQYTNRKVVLKRIGSIKEITAQADLVFWLSDQALSPGQIGTLPEGVTLFSYGGGKVQKLKSRIYDLSGTALTAAELYQKTSNTKAGAEPVWFDSFGNPVLSKSTTGGVKHYELYSRFRPEWTNLVWSDQMVMFLLPVVLPETAASLGFRDKVKTIAAVDEKNANKIETQPGDRRVRIEQQSLSPWIWWLLLMLFFAERWITYSKKLATV